MGSQSVSNEAVSLIRRTLDSFDDHYGSGSMSCAVYDTAWVSLVTKVVDGEEKWLFPECFQYLLDTQSPDGSWDLQGGSQIDGILNTAASLLSLQLHLKQPLDFSDEDVESLQDRAHRATASLRSQMSAWDVAATVHVGFEMIVPAILRYLQQEDESLVFEFPGRAALDKINATKLARFKPQCLYDDTKHTALHSLEVFIGTVNFDKLAHHKVHGAMMASPSSTAAYLTNATTWDDEAEAYLKHVVASGAGKGSGGVPSAYPSTHFEYTWILSTLVRAGFSSSDLDCPELQRMKRVLSKAFQNGKGIIGFAPFVGADVDDTAKGIVSLVALGIPVSPDAMSKEFEAKSHFRTYAHERDSSLSANANALAAFLCQPHAAQYSPQILKAVKFLCDSWWGSDGRIRDKWNLSNLYPSLLLVETLVDLIVLIERGTLSELLDQDMESRVLITLFQACLRTILEQQKDGAWNDSIEETAYGVLILSEARRLSLWAQLREPLDSAIDRGVTYIRSQATTTPNPIWIEKVSYASPLLTEAYVLAALKAASSLPGDEKVGKTLFRVELSLKGRKHVKLLQQTPLFSHTPQWQIQASMIESVLFQPLLRARRLDIFPRKDMEQDKYFDIIPFTWTSCNNRKATFAPTNFIYEMMIISFLNYQADEFMEAVAGTVFHGRIPALRELIDRVFSDQNNMSEDLNGDGSSNSDSNGELGYSDVLIPLYRFVTHVSCHPSILAANAWDRASVKRELRAFLHAHATQTEDNTRFQNQSQQNGSPHSSPQQHYKHEPGAAFSTATDTFFHWVRTTSADHTSCPYSFSFVSCLFSSMVFNGRECFPTVREKYLASATCRHLATMCRMYNDYGSVSRDADEGNVNSVNFPEYESCSPTTVDDKKKALLELAQYERACLDDAMARLAEAAPGPRAVGGAAERHMALWQMFCDVTDLYGQIYVVRDIASRMVASTTNGNGSAPTLKRKASAELVSQREARA